MEYSFPKEQNENGEELGQHFNSIKNNLNNENNKVKVKNSFSFKKADSFMKNVKQGKLLFPKSTKIIQKYDNYSQIKKDDEFKFVNKGNNEKVFNLQEQKTTEKVKSLNSSLNSSHN